MADLPDRVPITVDRATLRLCIDALDKHRIACRAESERRLSAVVKASFARQADESDVAYRDLLDAAARGLGVE